MSEYSGENRIKLREVNIYTVTDPTNIGGGFLCPNI